MAILRAAPALTPIADTLYNADGSKFQGSVTIEAPALVSNNSPVRSSSLTLQITSGVLHVSLTPTDTATPANLTYTVTYHPNGHDSYTEYWLVPTSGSALKVKDVLQAGASIGPLVTKIQANPTLPCNSANAGALQYSGHTAGVKDTVAVCAADSSNTFAFRTIY